MPKGFKGFKGFICLLLLLFYATGISALVLNSPYSKKDATKPIYYSAFSTPPKTLDPARSYNVDEILFMAQIFEPLLQYDYEKGEYRLIPLTATSLPEIYYLNKSGQKVSEKSPDAVFSVYKIILQPNIFYAPHAAFLKNKTYPRMLTVDDYIYQIKRLADPHRASPLYELLGSHIQGFRDFGKELPKEIPGVWTDLRNYPLSGVRKIDDLTFEIILEGQYPQFLFWLAMPFFAPIPWEVDQFYATSSRHAQNMGWNAWPVGTGPFMLASHEPQKKIILKKNPNFREKICEGKTKEMMYCRGKKLPLISEAHYTLDKENIPRWLKFLQGYYDISQVSADSFQEAVQITPDGKLEIGKALQNKNLILQTMMDPAIFYFGFNMRDPVVGGNSERARKLRLAISIAINYEENIALFLNGRGYAAHGPLPPGIFGYQSGKEGMNPYVYEFKNGKVQRRSLEEAKRLLKEAGYPNGNDATTGRPLILHYDVSITGTPDDKPNLDWMRKQFRALGISLDIRATNYNRFQEKMRSGNAQMFSWSWVADYPDPENFFFLFYGDNSRVAKGGENTANYQNPLFDELFLKMRNRPNDAERLALIEKMVGILRHDAPWAFGKFTQSIALRQEWLAPVRPDMIFLNKLQYVSVDPTLRNQRQALWNKAIFWPIIVISIIFLGVAKFLFLSFRRREQKKAPRVLK